MPPTERGAGIRGAAVRAGIAVGKCGTGAPAPAGGAQARTRALGPAARGDAPRRAAARGE